MDLREIVVTSTIKDQEKLVEVGINLRGLRFINSKLDGLE